MPDGNTTVGGTLQFPPIKVPLAIDRRSAEIVPVKVYRESKSSENETVLPLIVNGKTSLKINTPGTDTTSSNPPPVRVRILPLQGTVCGNCEAGRQPTRNVIEPAQLPTSAASGLPTAAAVTLMVTAGHGFDLAPVLSIAQTRNCALVVTIDGVPLSTPLGASVKPIGGNPPRVSSS